MQVVHGLRFDNLRGDVFGGLTAAVVALPLALAFGVASGAGPVARLYGAIFVGFFAALFGGTPSQVSGPTGPMTVVMAGIVTQYGHEPAMATDEPSLSEDEKAALAEGGGRVILYHLSGPFSFGAAKGMARRLAASDEFDALVLDLREVPFLDSSASLGLEDAIKQAQGRNKRVYLVGVRPDVAKTLKRLGVLKLLPDDHHHVTRLEALRQAARESSN